MHIPYMVDAERSRIGIIASHLLGAPDCSVGVMPTSARWWGHGARITLVGSCIMDVQAWISASDTIRTAHEGSMVGKVTFSPGGVCMNIARALKRLEKQHSTSGTVVPDVRLVSAVGDDIHGYNIIEMCSRDGICTRSILRVPQGRTASVVVMFGSNGDAIHSVVDVSIIEEHVTAPVALESMKGISGICVTDGDLGIDVIERVCKEAALRGCAVVFEPATVSKASKCVGALKHIQFITPNVFELEKIAEALWDQSSHGDLMHVEACHFGKGRLGGYHEGRVPLILVKAKPCIELLLRAGVGHVLLTAGDQGAALCWKEERAIRVLFCPAIPVENVVSVNGAGDSLVAGFIYALCLGNSKRDALVFGVASAWEALVIKGNVPEYGDLSRFHSHVAMLTDTMQCFDLPRGCCCSRCCSAISTN